MADFQFDPATGEYKYVGTSYSDAAGTAVAEEEDEAEWKLGDAPRVYSPERQQQLKNQRELAAQAETLQDDDRPLFAENAGQFFGDLGKSIANPIASIGTDYVDLAHGLVDVAGETGNLIQGKGFDVSKVFDDSDNPLTKARTDAFRSETQAGQFVNTTLRVVAAFATLPKTALKGIIVPLKMAAKAPVVGGGIGKVASKLTKLDDAYQAGRKGNRAVTEALKNAGKGKKGGAANLGAADDWLQWGYKDLIQRGGTEGPAYARMFRATEQAVRNITKGKGKLRTLGEGLAWDMFIAFNMAGEGDPMLDETMSDMLADYGLPNIPLFQTNMADTGLEAKFKQMGEGLLLNSALNGFLDVARIYRFSRAYKNAPAAEKSAIIEAFNKEGAGLGKSIAELEELDVTARQVQGPQPKLDNYQLLDMQLGKVQGARDKAQLTQEAQAQFYQQQRDKTVQIVPTEPVGALTKENLGGVPPVEVPVAVIRPPEPTVTPQTIRSGLYQYARERFGDEAFFPDLTEKIKRLMPRNRVDAIDYFEAYPFQYNAGGTMNAADSISNNYMIQRGLAEGWVQLGDDMQFTYNRGAAFELDRGEFDLAQANRIDEVAEIERYNQTLARSADETDPAMADVQNALDPAKRDAQEAARQYDDYAANAEGLAKPEPKGMQDQALVEAQRREALAKTKEAGLVNEEELKIVADSNEQLRRIDEITLLGPEGSDRQIVAEMLGVDLNQVEGFQIEKIGNRQYQIVNELGESIDGRNYSTLKAAKKGKEIADKGQVKELVARARAQADELTTKPVRSRIDADIVDSPLVRGEVSLTKRQMEVLNELGVPLNSSKLNLTQAELSGMARSIDQLLESATGAQKRVLQNVQKRIAQQVSNLTPAARMAAEVDKSIEIAQKFLKDGEICF